MKLPKETGLGAGGLLDTRTTRGPRNEPDVSAESSLLGALLAAVLLRSRVPLCDLDLFHKPMRQDPTRCRGCFKELWLEQTDGCEACGSDLGPVPGNGPRCDECGSPRNLDAVLPHPAT